MLVAVIAAVAAIVAAIVVIVVAFSVVNKRRASDASPKKHVVRQVSSVGVSSSLNSAQRQAASQHMAQDPGPSASPASGLKNRFIAMGVFAAAVFGSLLAKTFSMQVIDSARYSSQSEENAYTSVPTQAPRGIIYDADGVAIVRNRTSMTVVADPDVSDDRDVMRRLSVVLGVPLNVVRQRIEDATSGAQAQRTVASDVRLRDVAFISEHADAFPGVEVQSRTVRDYPYGALASHVVGYTLAATEDAIENASEGRVILLTDEVGHAGVEAQYDDLLAGEHGERVVIADAQGNVREVVSQTDPSKGSDVYLTIKAPVQYMVDTRLAELIAPDGVLGSGTGVGGAAVVMDVRDGGIVALSSYPCYEPARFVGGISARDWEVYNDSEGNAGNPMMNRVMQGDYPAASTYKAFTSLAGLEFGFATREQTWTCTGSWDGFGSGDWQDCWLDSGHGTLDLREGIVQSCDVVFYEIAKAFFDNMDEVGEDAMQSVIERFNFGKEAGIDLPEGENTGRVPTPEWKREYYRDFPEEAAWRGGDQTNMVIGQGYVSVTPLQIAVAYGAIATGKLMRPHVLKEVRNAQGEVVIAYEPEVVGEPDVSESDLEFVRDALHGVGTENAEVANLFAEYGIDAAAKTGTAEKAGEDDSAWFVCYAPYDDPKYVVAVVIEQGGGGSAVAAPVGVDIMNAVLQADAGTLDATVGVVAGATGESVEYQGTSSGRTD